MGNVIVIVTLTGAVVWAISHIYKTHKNGDCCSGCSGCTVSGNCSRAKYKKGCYNSGENYKSPK